MPYFLLRCDEDGTHVEQLSAEELTHALTPNVEGLTDFGSDLTFLDHIPRSDKGYWMEGGDHAMVIIKGEIVVPRPVAVVTKLELP